MEFNIQHDLQGHRFFVEVEGKKANLQYTVLPDGRTLDYHHTFVPPELRGKKIGEELVKFALEYAKKNNFKVIPSCPFVQRIIQRHPKYL